MKNLIKVFSKYLCFGAATAGVVAPVTYFTTRENIEENEEFKAILKQVEEKKKEIDTLDGQKQVAEKRVAKLQKCISDATVSRNFRKVGRAMQEEKIVFFGGTDQECKQ